MTRCPCTGYFDCKISVRTRPSTFGEDRRVLDVEKIATYAHSKGVKLMLWLPARTFLAYGNAFVLD
ncbi:MAG: hypothetical protein ABFD16_09935, partial [Thermoguttaceae bacterium]